MRTFFAAAALIGLSVAVPAFAQDQQPAPTPTPATVTPVLTIHPTPAPSKSSGSLADTVRKRKASTTPTPKKRSLGVISNENLKKPEGTGKGSVQLAPAKPIGQLPADSALSPGTGPSENQWRGRAASARERIETAESEVKRLEAETKRLENDFYVWSDGNYRDRVIKPAWDQAKDDLKKARAELDAAQAAQSDLDEEARKAGVPAGWLRDSPR